MQNNFLKNDLVWVNALRKEVSFFFREMKGRHRQGFYKYSESGDLFSEKFKWGLGNSVFFLKIVYTLGVEKEFEKEVAQSISFIKSITKYNI